MKPCCIYSTNAPARMKPPGIDGKEPTLEAIKECREYAGQQMDAAKENELYICGMQPLDPDNPMHGVIIARNGLECHDHVEFEYFSQPYQNAAWYNAKLCAYCAGTSGLAMDLWTRNSLWSGGRCFLCARLSVIMVLFPWSAQGRGTDLPEQGRPRLLASQKLSVLSAPCWSRRQQRPPLPLLLKQLPTVMHRQPPNHAEWSVAF